MKQTFQVLESGKLGEMVVLLVERKNKERKWFEGEHVLIFR